MSIFSRFADIINSNMNALLDKAENPEKLIRMIIQEMEDTLVEVRTTSAKTLAEKKELLRRLSWLDEEIDDWQSKAELALVKEREDLAKAALSEKHKLELQRQGLDKEILQLDETIGKLTNEINQLQEKLIDARTRQQALQSRYDAQKSRVKISRKLYEANSDNVVQRYENIERKLDQMEAEVETNYSQSASTLQSQFDELETEEKVDSELADLKAKLKQSSKDA
ncbi:MAG: phage shock protein PspA [Gammaproteobacteria bacterium]|nr:phage shock protein PspA [Gammaproteobacteria bacterium]NVK89406.1 phage shock protein PspA [Gammaproteobacteria bacterium]